MPKLLQINVTANWGSTGKIAELIGRKAIDCGWQSYIAYGRTGCASQSTLIKVGGIANTLAHYAGQRIFDSEGLHSSRATGRLIRKIDEIEPDIVQLHNIHDHYLNYRMLFEYLNRLGVNVVWTLHDFWPITGHCMHFVSKKCDRFITGCHDCPMRTVYPKSMTDRSERNHALKKQLFGQAPALTLVAVSDWVAGPVRKSFLGNHRIEVINNGIDLSRFKPVATADDPFDGKFVIMSVASQWKYDKGLEDYRVMAAMLRDDEIIVLVGVDDDLRKSLPPNIIGIGRTSSINELAALYTRADVITILSSAETFGLTVVEGYACGTPAVVYDNTAPPALITPQTGLVVPDKDVAAAYGAIQQIRLNGKCHYRQACIQTAKTKYDQEICSTRYIELYDRLLKA